MKQLLKIILIVLGLGLLALLSWGLALFEEWPLWTAAVLFFGTIGLFLASRFAKRLILVYRTKHRVAQAVLQEQQLQPTVDFTASLERQWADAIAALKSSNLKRTGDPLYGLPWYLMIGARGAGKTSALMRARLASPLQEVDQATAVAETPTCQFWFLNRAIVVDTTGRYAAPAHEARDQAEWERLLFLLSRHRKKESLSGLVVAVAADRLLGTDLDALAEEGRLIRKRIDQLMRLLDTKFPVYVLVTKCDVLYGLADWCRHLPERVLDQAMGYVGGLEEREGPEAATFLENAFQHVGDRLKELRLLVAYRLGALDQRLLLFPDEFERLKPGLQRFWNGCFSSDPYLEPPFTRGLFFCSAQQPGGAASAILKEQGLPDQSAEPPNADRGLFLAELLGRILPGDRGLSRPFSYVPHWHRMTRNIGLASWVLIGVTCVILLTGSFTRSFSTMTQLMDEFPGVPALSGRLSTDLEGLTKFYPLIKWIEKRDRSWLVRLVPFNKAVVALEAKLKGTYAETFHAFMLGDLDGTIESQLSTLSEQHATRLQAEYIQHIVRRINLIQARLNGQGLAGLAALPPPSLDALALPDDEAAAPIKPEVLQTFGDLYVAYVAWHQHEDLLRLEQQTLQAWLNRYALESGRLSWLDEWADNQPALKPVTLYEFWQGSRVSPEALKVRSAYTREGKRAIDGFIEEIEAAAPNRETMAALKAMYETRYLNQKLRAWYAFAWNFDLGRKILDGELEWRTAVEHMTTFQGPYYALLGRMVQEFEEYRDDQRLPAWLTLARTLNALRPAGSPQGLVDKAKVLTGIVNQTGRDVIKSTVAGEPKKGKDLLDDRVKAAKAFEVYLAELNKLWMDAVSGQGRAYKIASDFHSFAVDPAIKESALLAAHKALQELQRLVGGVEYFETRAVWALVGGPLRFFTEFVEQETACSLQRAWEAKVVYPTQGAASKSDLFDLLYGTKGVVWAFVDGPAKPFVARDARLYSPVETLAYRVPFTGEFFAFINDALHKTREQTAEKQKSEQVQKQVKAAVEKKTASIDRSLGELKKNKEGLQAKPIPVTITPLPTGVNAGARAIPHATLLSVQCAGGIKSVPNYNFPVTVGFEWSPLTCGDTTLQIRLENFTLTKKYAGPIGFARFLQDFYDGHHTFVPGDFPVEQAGLQLLGISTITVRYEFAGQDAILEQITRMDQIERQEKELQEARRQIQEQQDNVEEEALLAPFNESDPVPVITAILPARLQRIDDALAEVKRTRASAALSPVSVMVRGLPTSVNQEARVAPFGTLLTLSCAGGSRTVPNYNFPVTAAFDWSPGSCGETILEIKLDGLTVVKRYEGPLGFARFLQDFYDGQHVFTPNDFPADQPKLELQQVKRLTVRYEFKGHDTILAQLRQFEQLDKQEQRLLHARQRLLDQLERLEEQALREPQTPAKPGATPINAGAVPATIAVCWEGGGAAPQLNPTPTLPRLHTTAPVPPGRHAAGPATPAQPLARPVALRPDAGARSFEVQVGAFLDGADAQALARTLERRGYFPYLLEERDEGKREWHTVFIGRYPDRALASDVAEAYKRRETLPALVRESAR